MNSHSLRRSSPTRSSTSTPRRATGRTRSSPTTWTRSSPRTPDKIAAIDARRRGHLRRTGRRGRPGRPGLPGAGHPARRRHLLPAAQLDRVPGRALRGHPDRRGQQPAHPDLPRPRGRLHGRPGRVEADRRPGRSSAATTTPPWSSGSGPEWPALQHVLVVGGKSEEANRGRSSPAPPWEERRDPAELAALRPDPNEVTLLIFTSGTTGEPKGVMHTHNTLVAANAPLPDRLGVGPDDVIHMASTFAHLTGFLYGVRLPVQVGGATACTRTCGTPRSSSSSSRSTGSPTRRRRRRSCTTP